MAGAQTKWLTPDLAAEACRGGLSDLSGELGRQGSLRSATGVLGMAIWRFSIQLTSWKLARNTPHRRPWHLRARKPRHQISLDRFPGSSRYAGQDSNTSARTSPFTKVARALCLQRGILQRPHTRIIGALLMHVIHDFHADKLHGMALALQGLPLVNYNGRSSSVGCRKVSKTLHPVAQP